MGEWLADLIRMVRSMLTVDLRAIATVRIVLGIVILVDLIRRLGSFDRWYGADPIYPLDAAVADSGPTISVHLLSANPWVQAALFALAIVAAAAMTVGWHTRLMTSISWFLLVSLHQRNWLIQDLGDSILVLTLFWVMLNPAGDRFSLDERRRGVVEADQTVFSVASAGLLLQPAWVMFFAGLSKLRQPVWRDGSAVQTVLEDDIWSWALANTLLDTPSLLRLLTWATVGIEILAPLALFVPRLRTAALLVIAGFVAGLGLTIQLGLIPWAMALAFVPFLPGKLWDRFWPTAWSAGSFAPRGVTPLVRSVSEGIAAVSLCYVFLANVRDVVPPADLVPAAADTAAVAARMEQGWSMYASPTLGRSRVAIQMRFDDGSEQLMAIGSDREGWPTTPPWQVLDEIWADSRSRIFVYDNAAWPGMETELKALLAWLHRQWMAENPSSVVERIELVKVQRSPYGSEGADGIRPLVSSQTLAVLQVD